MSFLSAAMPILSVAGSAFSALGSIQSGYASAAQADYEAQVAKNNAIIASQNAAYAAQAGEANAYDTGLNERAKSGAVTAGLAASGLDVNTGSAEDVRRSEAELGQTNVERVRSNASLLAYGYRTQSSNYTAQAGLKTNEASNDISSGYLKGFSSLLSAAKDLPIGGGTSGASGIGSSATSGFASGFQNGLTFDFSTA